MSETNGDRLQRVAAVLLTEIGARLQDDVNDDSLTHAARAIVDTLGAVEVAATRGALERAAIRGALLDLDVAYSVGCALEDALLTALAPYMSGVTLDAAPAIKLADEIDHVLNVDGLTDAQRCAAIANTIARPRA